MSTQIIRCISMLLVLMVGGVSLAAWPSVPEGKPIYTAEGHDSTPVVDSDGEGGMVFAWTQNDENYHKGLFVQRIDSWGNVLWGEHGVLVCDHDNEAHIPDIVSDGNGGAYVVWIDYRINPPDIYAQHIDADGQPSWTADGLAICTEADYQFYPNVLLDAYGDAYFIWYDFRDSGNIYGQLVSRAGTAQWTADGTPLGTGGTPPSRNSRFCGPMRTDAGLSGETMPIWMNGRIAC